MAFTPPDVGAGMTCSFGSYTPGSNNLLDIDWSGISRESIETTNTATTFADTFMPTDTYDPGTVTMRVQFDADAVPPILAAVGTLTMTWPQSVVWTCSGFCTGFSITGATKTQLEATVTIKLTGRISIDATPF